LQSGVKLNGASVNVLGLTFKENCPDLRNSQVFKVIQELRSYGLEVSVCDPIASAEEARREHGIELLKWAQLPRADAVVLAVAHQDFIERLDELKDKFSNPAVLIDVKSVVGLDVLPKDIAKVWRL